jgi:hypothetical protein
VDQVEWLSGKRIMLNIMAQDLKVGEVQGRKRLKVAQINIGHQDMAADADASREPAGNRASASAHFPASPALAYPEGVEAPHCGRIVKGRQTP